MYAVQDEVETIHLYVVREPERQPSPFLPLVGAVCCLLVIVAVTLYSGLHPAYRYARLSIPAEFLPLKTFSTHVPVIPTGSRTYPATTATGTLTLTNGSVLSEVLPPGVVFGGKNGAEVQTTAPAFIPAGSATGYGVATVPAKAVVAGRAGNLPILALNAVYGMALYIRNLAPFTGGTDASTVTVITQRDRQLALTAAQAALTVQRSQVKATLVSPCGETIRNQAAVIGLVVRCQFATYHVPASVRVVAARLSGKNFLVDVVLPPCPVLVGTR